MIDRMQRKTNLSRINQIETHISEANLSGHLFAKATGFVAVDIVKDYYPDSDFDAYLFRWELGTDAWAVPGGSSFTR